MGLSMQRKIGAAAVGAALLSSLCLAAPLAAAEGVFLVDSITRCGTISPFYVAGESIRWFGACRDGRLEGPGTLIWYRDQVEFERNVGTFKDGEFDGSVVTTFPDGQVIYGQYSVGARNGDFMVVRQDGSKIAAVYERGALKSQRRLDDTEAAQWAKLKSVPAAAYSQTAQVAKKPQPVLPQAQTAPQRQVAVTPRVASAQQKIAPAQQVRPARRAAPVSAEGDEEGWIGSFFSALNPLNWGLFDAVSGLFGSSTAEIEQQPRAISVAAAAVPVQSATAPRSAAQRPRAPAATRRLLDQPRPIAAQPTARPAARQVAAAPQPTPAYQPPVIVERTSNATLYGKVYDMRAFLAEPYPLAKMPNAKASIPVMPSAGLAPGIGYQDAAFAGQLPGAQPWRPSGVTTARTEIADSLFAQAYEAEQQGDRGRATSIYEQVLLRHPSAPSASIANDRLTALRGAGTQVAYAAAAATAAATATATAAGQPDEQVAVAGSGAHVIAMNNPYPAPYRSPVDPSASAAGGFYGSPLINHEVCTRDGLYDSNAKWCGVVRRDDGEQLLVEVRDVHVPGFGMFGITRSACTGGQMLTWFSRNTTVSVPRQCLSAVQ